MPEDARTYYPPLDGHYWGKALSEGVIQQFSEAHSQAPETIALVEADVGRTVRVRRESLTSAATAAVATTTPPTIPGEEEREEMVLLTACVHDVPVSHDGSAKFTFEPRFSEQIPLNYTTLRDHAFTVTGGDVVTARRLEPGNRAIKNVRWEISVTPDGNGTVKVVLPPTTDCEAEGAVCTGDGRMLSNRLEIVVQGPP